MGIKVILSTYDPNPIMGIKARLSTYDPNPIALDRSHCTLHLTRIPKIYKETNQFEGTKYVLKDYRQHVS